MSFAALRTVFSSTSPVGKMTGNPELSVQKLCAFNSVSLSSQLDMYQREVRFSVLGKRILNRRRDPRNLVYKNIA